MTGGFSLEIGGLRFASHNIGRPLLVLAAATVATVARGWRERGHRAAFDELRWWRDRGRATLLRARTEARRRVHLAPTVIAILVIGLDVWQWMAATPMWLDEETIALNARDRSIGHLGGTLWLGQSAPIGWLALERAAMRAFGTSEVALRLVPLLFGVALIGTAVWIGRRWLRTAGATVLVLLCSLGLWLAHYRFETKQYTADAAFGLLLPALAVWALEDDAPSRTRRILIWWTAAALGQWFANGAMLVAPCCAMFLFLTAARRDGRRGAFVVAGFGGLWLAAFVLHYAVALRFTLASSYLQEFWRSRLPPPGSAASKVGWIASRLRPLADNPGGTSAWLLLWLSAAGGFIAAPTPLGLIYALVPLSAFVLAFLHVVPLFERLSIWMIPALYVGVALLVDRAIDFARGRGRSRALRVAVAAAVLGAELWLCYDVGRSGFERTVTHWDAVENHQLDDRAAVRSLIAMRQPGDAILTTHLGWPAVWWYGGMSLADPGATVGRLPDGGGMYEMSYRDPADCGAATLRERLGGARRVLVYIGFRDIPPGFDGVLQRELGGGVTAVRQFSGSIVIAADLDADRNAVTAVAIPEPAATTRIKLPGCVGVAPEVRW